MPPPFSGGGCSLVRFSKPKGFDWQDAAFEIEDATGKKVDLVTENSLSPYIQEFVLKDLQVLYELER